MSFPVTQMKLRCYVRERCNVSERGMNEKFIPLFDLLKCATLAKGYAMSEVTSRQ